MREAGLMEDWQTCYVAETGMDFFGCGASSNPCLTLVPCVYNVTNDLHIVIQEFSYYLPEVGYCGLTMAGVNPPGATYSLMIEGGGNTFNCDFSNFFLQWQVGANQSVVIENLEVLFCESPISSCINVTSTIANPSFNETTNTGTLMLESTGFAQCRSSLNGGAVFAGQGITVTLNNCGFQNCGSLVGGGVYSSWAINILNSEFEECNAEEGGAVYAEYSLTVFDSTFIGNIATRGSGGAVFVNQGYSVQLSRASFYDNQADSNGGSLALISAPSFSPLVSWFLSEIEVISSTATNGGGVWLYVPPNIVLKVVIPSSNFEDNQSRNVGGAIFTSGANLTVEGSTFSRNQAAFYGGGIYNDQSASLYLLFSTFSGNRANFGGALSTTFVEAQQCRFQNNEAQNGGAVGSFPLLEGAFFSCTFTGNKAVYDGGAAYVTIGSQALQFFYCTFEKNSANTGGALLLEIYALNESLLLGSSFTDNHASDVGGAIAARMMTGDIPGTFVLPPISHNTAKKGGGLYFFEGHVPPVVGVLGFNSVPQLDCSGTSDCPSYKKVSSCSLCSCLCAMGSETVCYDSC